MRGIEARRGGRSEENNEQWRSVTFSFPRLSGSFEHTATFDCLETPKERESERERDEREGRPGRYLDPIRTMHPVELGGTSWPDLGLPVR